MGKRSRKRGGAGTAVAAVPGARPPHARTPDRRARRSEAPKAPWAPFPLVELCVLIGMLLVFGGVLFGGDRRGLLLGVGFGLVTVAGLELAVREHAAGYRSHSALLAGCLAVVVVIPLFLLTGVPQEVLLVVAAAVFAAAFGALRAAFARRSGGLGFRA